METALDLLFPKRCPICDGIVGFRKGYVCPQCLGKIKPVNGPVCMKCGKPLSDEEEYCLDCRKKKHLFCRGAAVFEYRSIAIAIYRFKYGGRQEYAFFSGNAWQGGWGSSLNGGRRMHWCPYPSIVPESGKGGIIRQNCWQGRFRPGQGYQ